MTMKISLSADEVEAILLEHVNAKMGTSLNAAEFDVSYSSLREAVLTVVETVPTPDIKEAA